jgi:16S rRNA G1207 methylase RsmC
MREEATYEGRDLEAMSFAVNYHEWILQIFAPYLGRHAVEVGAGAGSFSQMLLQHPLETLALVEPSANMFQILSEQMAHNGATADITLHNAVFRQVAAQIKASQPPDSIIYVNVLEHIEDDNAELAAIHETLAAGGKLFVFVPALRWLYSAFDRHSGHFRRYTKRELEEKCARAGFRVIKSTYFDSVGIAPWLVRYRWLKSTTFEPAAVALYDRYVVPGVKALESFITPPLGKNIVLIAEKTTP